MSEWNPRISLSFIWSGNRKVCRTKKIDSHIKKKNEIVSPESGSYKIIRFVRYTKYLLPNMCKMFISRFTFSRRRLAQSKIVFQMQRTIIVLQWSTITLSSIYIYTSFYFFRRLSGYDIFVRKSCSGVMRQTKTSMSLLFKEKKVLDRLIIEK